MTTKTPQAFRASPWTDGRPPIRGWWNASTERDERARRFWDGDGWSAPVYCDDPRKNAQAAVTADAECDEGAVEWRGVAVGDMDLDELFEFDDPGSESLYCRPGKANAVQAVAQAIASVKLLLLKYRLVGWDCGPTDELLHVAPLPSYRCTLLPSPVEAEHAQA